jgi:hypothetical protein
MFVPIYFIGAMQEVTKRQAGERAAERKLGKNQVTLDDFVGPAAVKKARFTRLKKAPLKRAYADISSPW